MSNQNEKAIRSETFWIIPGCLMVGPYPSGSSELELKERLAWLSDQKVSTIVSLTEIGETTTAGKELIPYKSNLPKSIRVESAPIPDGRAPTIIQMQEILNFLESEIASRRCVYVHCRGGKFRTRMVIACFLIRHFCLTDVCALAMDDSIRSAQGIPTYALTESQRRFVTQWSKLNTEQSDVHGAADRAVSNRQPSPASR